MTVMNLLVRVNTYIISMQAMNLIQKKLDIDLDIMLQKPAGAINPLKNLLLMMNEQFLFESLLFSAMTLYNNGGAI